MSVVPDMFSFLSSPGLLTSTNLGICLIWSRCLAYFSVFSAPRATTSLFTTGGYLQVCSCPFIHFWHFHKVPAGIGMLAHREDNTCLLLWFRLHDCQNQTDHHWMATHNFVSDSSCSLTPGEYQQVLEHTPTNVRSSSQAIS